MLDIVLRIIQRNTNPWGKYLKPYFRGLLMQTITSWDLCLSGDTLYSSSKTRPFLKMSPFSCIIRHDYF